MAKESVGKDCYCPTTSWNPCSFWGCEPQGTWDTIDNGPLNTDASLRSGLEKGEEPNKIVIKSISPESSGTGEVV